LRSISERQNVDASAQASTHRKVDQDAGGYGGAIDLASVMQAGH
jgi:hypothetical protein